MTQVRVKFQNVLKLTVEECLFSGAPEWAVDVREYNWMLSHWSVGGKLFRHLGVNETVLPTRGWLTQLIYTRQKQERETVADASNWHERGELPPSGALSVNT